MTIVLPSPIALDTPSALAPLVRVTRLTVELAPDSRLEADPALAARIRGAFGHRLSAMAETENEARAAWRLLFSEKDEPQARGHAPAPFVIAADLLPDGRLAATLSLFGVADRWRTPAFDAFIAALSSPPGLSLSPPSRRRPAPAKRSPLSVLSVRWTRREGVDPPSRFNQLRLRFATPLQFGPDGHLSERHDDIVVGLAERVSLLAPLFGCRYLPRLGEWRDLARRTRIDTTRLKPERFLLWSSGGGARMRHGWTGDLVIVDPTPDMSALLAIGEQIGCGRDAAKGFGRYALYAEA